MNLHRESVRFQILKSLYQSPSYTANQVVLLEELRRQGHALNRDQLVIELAWLSNTAQAVLDSPVQGVHVATLSLEGLEYLQGTRIIPGIRRPLPGEVQ